MKMSQILASLALAALAFATIGSTARADSFNVTLDTSSLSGTQTLAFDLTNNDGPANNTVTLSGFDFGGGSADAGTEDCTLGGSLSGVGCSGNLTSGVTLTDTADEVFFTEQFEAGSSLSFNMETTNNFAGGIPDGLAMYVCDATLTTCYSDDSSTFAMLVLGLDGSPLSPSSFTLNGAMDQDLPAPVVTEGTGTTTPEPSTFALFALAMLAFVALARRKHRAEVHSMAA